MNNKLPPRFYNLGGALSVKARRVCVIFYYTTIFDRSQQANYTNLEIPICAIYHLVFSVLICYNKTIKGRAVTREQEKNFLQVEKTS